MKPWRPRTLRLSRRHTSVAALTALLMAAPLWFLATPGASDEPRRRAAVVPRPVPPARAQATATEAAASASRTRGARSVVERVRTLPDAQLRALVGSGSRSERLAAIHALWTRGLESEAEALARSSGDRALLAKVEALKTRGR